MRYLWLFLCVVVFSAIFAGCGGGGGGGSTLAPPVDDSSLINTRADAAGRGVWTVLIYLDGDNDLESGGILNFNQMETVGSTKDVRIIVQMDRTPNYDTSNGNWTDTRRYLITRDSDSSAMHSIRLDDPALGELDMGDWHTLRDFVEWGVGQFPADHYCLIVWDHGSGWSIRSMSTGPATKYIAVDDTDNGGMNVTDIPAALRNVRMDVVAFDACLMQQLETAYELKDSTSYMVGSAAPEPSPGYDYAAWLARINASTSPRDLCRIIVDEFGKAYPAGYVGITQSALDETKIGALASATSRFSDMLISHAASDGYALTTARTAALNYSVLKGGTQRYSLDLLDYATRSAQIIGPDADAALAGLRSALSDAVVRETHNPDTPNAHGLGIYVPPPFQFDYTYNRLRIASDTTWDEWIHAQPR